MSKSEQQIVEFASEQQKQLFLRGPLPTLASGGFNAGKTRGAILKALYLMDTYRGYRVAIVRRRHTELEKTTLPTLFKMIPTHMIAAKNDQKGELILKNGSRFDFLHLEKPDVSTVLRGLEINGFILDQAEEMLEDTFDVLETRVNRWDQADVPKEIVAQYEANGTPWPWRVQGGTTLFPPPLKILTCNPDIELHWLWRRFHPDSPEWQNNWRKKGYLMIHFPSRSNKFAAEQNLLDMESKGEDFVRRYVKGEWGRPEGILFDVPHQSIIDPSDDILAAVKSGWSLHRILDHGYSAPTCCLWGANDRDGNLLVYKEYYEVDDQIRRHREKIFALSGGSSADKETYRSNLADPSIFQMMPQRAGGRWSVAMEYTDTKIYPADTAIWWTRADNQEAASRHRIQEYLWIDPKHKNPFTGELGAPRLYFMQKTDKYPHGCDKAITELKSQRLTKVGTVNNKAIFSDERDETIPDHAYDCVRYFTMSRPLQPGQGHKVGSIKTFDGYSKLAKDQRRLVEAMGRANK